MGFPRRNPSQCTALVESLEDDIQLSGPFLEVFQVFRPPADVPLHLSRPPAADVHRKLLGVLPGLGGHPAQSLQHHLVQNTLPDVMGSADLRTLLFVGTAGEVVVGGAHGVAWVQLVLQNIGRGTAGPVVWRLHIRAGVTYAKLPVGVDHRAQHLFPLQHPGNLARAVPGSAPGEYPAAHRPGFLVDDQFLLFILPICVLSIVLSVLFHIHFLPVAT